MYYYQNGCPYSGAYAWDCPNMYRAEEHIEEKAEEEAEGAGDQRQFPGAGPGAPGAGAGHMPGVTPGQYTGNPAEIVRIIEMNHPNIIRTMMNYGIPFPAARRIIMQIVRATLRYCR